MSAKTGSNDPGWVQLASRLQGSLVLPGDPTYDEARAVWNGRIDRRPAAIARCAGATDVVAALEFARENRLVLAVRGGGHDYAGTSVCDDGLVIDLSPMSEVQVDPEARTVRVQAGARWSAVDAAAQPHGLAAVSGTVSSVGVAGFTLGGGMGHLTRRHGLAIDNLLSAEVVTTRGQLIRASEAENPDLFWAIRGGGGNFGVVTSFEFRLHEVGPEVLAGQIVYPYSDVEKVLQAYRDFTAGAPDELTCYAFIIHIPPIPAFPEEYHGQVAIDLVLVYTGSADAGLRLVEPLRRIGAPILDFVEPQPYLAVQQTFDAGVPNGLRWFSRAHNLDALTDEAIATIGEQAREVPGPFTMVYLMPGGGAAERVDPTATAYPHRATKFSFHVLSGWSDAGDDDANILWTKGFHDAMRPFASGGGVYVNLLSEDERLRVRESYGSNYERLAEIKRKWDPDNLLKLNHNITPED